MDIMTTERRIRNLLSMAQKAGRIVSGSTAVEQALQAKKAKRILVAVDATEDSREKFEYLSEKYKIPCSLCLTKEALGECLGREYRAVAALLDKGFSDALRKLLDEMEENVQERSV